MNKHDEFIIKTIEGINGLIKENIKPRLDANASYYLVKRMRQYKELK